ncbi:hypothetical protein AB0I81_29670 [Nonomuraea sp. NPDC050404]|uniref:hypothetical protein n=1 Tax=Nonomuraea sp. NPDC050404 TaxID=3155783 RepID=UPI0033FE8530
MQPQLLPLGQELLGHGSGIGYVVRIPASTSDPAVPGWRAARSTATRQPKEPPSRQGRSGPRPAIQSATAFPARCLRPFEGHASPSS